MPGVEVNGVTVTIEGRKVLDRATFSVPAGSLTTIVGPSGSGKTTLFRTILGELEPEEGTVSIDGRDVTGDPLQERGVGTVYQTYALFPHMTVAENIGYGLAVRGTPKKQVRERVAEMLSLVRLEGKDSTYPHALSGGEMQRVAVARALAVRPRLLLLDEAFTALDATTRHEVVREARALIERLSLTTLLITHDQEEAFLFGSQVVVLNEGRVVTVGRPEEILAHPHPFIRDFVKMILFRKGRIEKDDRGQSYVALDGDTRIPVFTPGLADGTEVQVMIKRGPEAERIRVFPYA